MGAIAEAIVAYAQPLIDETDGSMEQMQKALNMSQTCWNIAILPPDQREDAMNKFGTAFKLTDAEIEDLKNVILRPMVRRHEEMFPRAHQPEPVKPPHTRPSMSPIISAKSAKEKSSEPEPGRYDLCPCNSGRKYKFCCGQKA